MEELPLALEYGMTPQQYWEEDMDLFYAYQIAYTNRLHKEAHIKGLYEKLAIEMAIGNCFKKESDKAINYIETDIYNPYNKKAKEKPKNEVKSEDRLESLFHIKRKIENSKKGEQ